MKTKRDLDTAHPTASDTGAPVKAAGCGSRTDRANRATPRPIPSLSSTERTDQEWRTDVKTQVALHLITHAIESLQQAGPAYEPIVDELLRIKSRAHQIGRT